MANKESKTDKTYSVTEVGTLVKGLRTDIRSVAEGVTFLREDMDDVKTRLSSVENRLIGVEDAVRVAIPSLSSRVSALETKTGV